MDQKRTKQIIAVISMMLLVGCGDGFISRRGGTAAEDSIELRGGKDQGALKVAILAPTSGSTIMAGTVAVKGTSSARSGINRVEVKIDSGTFILASPRSPGDWSSWTASFSVSSAGSHVVTAKAIDTKGKTSSTSVSFIVQTAEDSSILLQDDFELLPLGETWNEGQSYGNWKLIYKSYGSTGIETDGTKVLTTQPMVSTAPNETHAPLIHSVKSFSGDIEVEVRMKTIAQLRVNSPPNTWETAWMSWHGNAITSQSYYFTLKTNGWELGKGNGQPPNNQEFLATGDSPKVQIGAWHNVKIRQIGNLITVWVDGQLITSVADDHSAWPVYTSGEIGLYNEDSHTHFDDVIVRRP